MRPQDDRRNYADTSVSGSGLVLRAAHLNNLYQQVLAYLLGMGKATAPRGQSTLEIRGATLVLENARANIITIPERRLNYCFQIAEWLWILLGRNDVASLAHYNKNIAQFSDDGVVFKGAYGAMIMEHDQLGYVLERLTRDPNSRQAVITFWRPSPYPSKDIPCTLDLQFFIRGGLLHCHGHMRSNDAWLGLPYDIFNFTQLQQYVAMKLGVEVGEYVHHVGSLHLYAHDSEKAYFVKNATSTRTAEGPALTPLGLYQDLNMMFSLISQPGGGNYEEITGVPEPWLSYLRVLQYRDHKDLSRVTLEPYRQLLLAQDRALKSR